MLCFMGMLDVAAYYRIMYVCLCNNIHRYAYYTIHIVVTYTYIYIYDPTLDETA